MMNHLRNFDFDFKLFPYAKAECMEAFVNDSDGLKVLHEYLVKARDEHKSSLVLKILKTLKRLPITLAALQATDRAEFG
jgi:hypothetical protein